MTTTGGDFVPDEECPVCGSTNIVDRGDGDRTCLDGPHRWNKDGKQRPRSKQNPQTSPENDNGGHDPYEF